MLASADPPRSRRRRNVTRPAMLNPQAREVAVAAGIIVLVVGVAGTATALVLRNRRRARENRLPIDTVTPEGGGTEPPRGGALRSSDAVPTPTGPAPEIIAGGVPLAAGWHTAAWYRYPPSSDQAYWIRIDQRGVPSWSETTNVSFDAETHGHVGRITGAWRWTVVAGEATPLATELLEGTYTFQRPLLYLRYDRESLENGMLDYAAQRAADWIDTAFRL